MGGTCSAHRNGKNFVQNLVEKPESRDYSDNLDVDGG